MLQEEHFPVIRVSIANPLKDEVCAAVGITREYMEEQKNICRPLLIAWTEFRRFHDADYWVKQVLPVIDIALRRPAAVVLIDDARWLNDAVMIKNAGAYLIYLDCPVADSIQYMQDKGLFGPEAASIAKSPSETTMGKHLDMFDLVIDAPRSKPLNETLNIITAHLEVAGIFD